ncbi:MAG: hydroxymethylglutaryl-CoA lyase [Myxococcales bacterium]|nr:hydroxymethylglutaryl-CoA lyase [Myxococcales bacterium]MCB9543724.1 hydroxymethylglutaryl-CoA lyase [Myxococcales bacterium]MCB9552719.1 hydroxymethylglutaryl-CoA lyase [Myxococcales bacterium]
MPKKVQVYEVGPRDGLQNEKAFVASEDKMRLIDALTAAGLGRIEITSFVHPRWIPALADAGRVAERYRDVTDGPTYTALVPNTTGLDRALEAGLREIAVFMSASETHNRRNINKTRDETYAAFEPVFATCAERGVAVRAYVSTVWGCPYEGAVDPAEAAAVAARLLAMGAYEISLGDTIGVGNPRQTARVLDVVGAKVPLDRIAMHMHDTRGTALANCLVGLEYGVTTFDASVAGLGGCPYAPGASGNLATEDLVNLLHGMEIETGVDLDKLVDAGLLAQQLLGRTLPSRALQALAARR